MIISKLGVVMLIDARRILEHKYREVFPNLQLAAVTELAIPVSKIDVEVLGEVVKPIAPITEYLLRFVDLGLDTSEQLSEALGLPAGLCDELVSDEHRSGNLKILAGSSGKLSLTPAGRETLRTCLTSSPKVTIRQYLFDTTDSWKVSNAGLSYFMSKRDMNNQSIEAPRLSKARTAIVDTEDLDVIELNRRSRGVVKQERFEIQQVRKVTKRRHGFILAQLLVYFDGNNRSDFLIDLEGERLLDHESWLRKSGGLESVGIKLEALTPEDRNSVIAQISQLEPIEIVENDPDGGIVAPYDHPDYLKDALEVSKSRLLIFSPWVSAAIVNDDFRYKLEQLLKRGVSVTIGWGFGTDRESEKSKNHASALRRLQKLTNHYKNFNFVKLDESHAKVLIYDDTYIATSFNWLSFKGDKNLTYRTEIGEKRTNKKAVDDRYKFMIEESISRGQKMTEALIPQS
jgi:hypothetical protein